LNAGNAVLLKNLQLLETAISTLRTVKSALPPQIQLMGIIPYFVINVLAALTNVSITTFMWTTFVGSLPILGIYAFAGGQLYSVESVKDIFSPSIIALLVVLILDSLMPLLLRFSRRVTDLE